jgi:hypothetical protein
MDQVPTEPFRKLLDRDLAKVTAKPITDIASLLLIDVVNEATTVFQRCQVSIGREGGSKTEKDEGQHLAPFILYRQMVEIADGVEVLISSGCSEATLPLLRSMLEALLSLDYMLQKDYKRRSLSWLCSYVHKRIDLYESVDSSTDRGKELKKILKKEGGPVATTFSSSKNVKRLQELLTGKLRPIEEEFKRQKKKRPHWYSLFGGPPDLRSLALQVSKGGYYDLLYRDWSSIMHATDLSRFLTKTSAGGGGFHPLRYPASLKNYACYAVWLLVVATEMMIKEFRPGEDISRWKSEIEERLTHLRNLKIKINPIKE